MIEALALGLLIGAVLAISVRRYWQRRRRLAERRREASHLHNYMKNLKA